MIYLPPLLDVAHGEMDRRQPNRRRFCNHGQVSEHSEAEEMHWSEEDRRYEEERRAAGRRRNQVSWVIVAWVMAAALALLGHDSATAALGAHRDGRPWVYPAGLAVTCGIALVVLAAWGVRRARRH
jgi:hypothetical protein